MRVLIVTTEAPDAILGGLGVFHRLLWKELRKAGVNFRTVYLYTKEPSQACDYNVPWRYDLPFDFGPDAKSLATAWTVRNLLAPILREYKPTVISCHEQWTFLPFFFEAERVQFTLHSSYIGMEAPEKRGYDQLHQTWLQKTAIEKSAVTVVHSSWAAEMIAKHVTSKSVRMFPIGIDQEEFSGEKDYQPKPVVAFFGRHTDPAKGFDVFRQAAKQHPTLDFRFYSPIPAEGEDKQWACGFVDGEAKRKAFAQADVVLMPSVRESFGLVGLEAKMSNCILVADTNLGMGEYHDGPRVDELERVLDVIENETEAFRELGMLQGFSVRHFTAERMAGEYIKIWGKM